MHRTPLSARSARAHAVRSRAVLASLGCASALAAAASADVVTTFTVVVKEGSEHGIGFFVIADGEASVSIDGHEVSRIGPGGHFGEVALISDRIRTASVTALTDLHTYVMTVWDFRAFVQGDAEVAWKLLEQLAEMLHHQQKAQPVQ